jgi:hypothetical protein
MANALYDKGRQAYLEGSIASLTDNLKVVLVNGALYTPNLATDQFLSDIPAGARVATSGNLAGKTTTAGVFNASNVLFSALTGSTINYIAGYKDTGVATTSPLSWLDDTATGMPFTPSGQDETLAWDSGANKIFKL